MPWMKSKYDSHCKECETLITAGEKIYYNGKAYCIDCGEELTGEKCPNMI